MNIKQTIFLGLILSFIINTTSTAAGLCTAPTIENITPGVYQTQNGFCYKLEGPTPSADRFIYTIRGYNEFTGCHVFLDKFTAFITTGSANGHPDIGDREIVPILKENYVYGFISGGASFNTGSIDASWDRNQLLGVRQSGNQLIVGVFSDGVNQEPSPIRNESESAPVFQYKMSLT